MLTRLDRFAVLPRAGTPAPQCGTGVLARQIAENGVQMSKLQEGVACDALVIEASMAPCWALAKLGEPETPFQGVRKRRPSCSLPSRKKTARRAGTPGRPIFFLLLEFKLSRTARKPPLPKQRRRFSAGSSEICRCRSARPGKFIYIIHAYAGVCFGSTCACRFAAPNAGSLILSCPVSRWPARRH